MMHRVEDWRDRLLAEGDKALAALLDDYPQADRQQLRTLVRNAQAEKARTSRRALTARSSRCCAA